MGSTRLQEEEEAASFSGSSGCFAGELLCGSEAESFTDAAGAASADGGSGAGSSALVLAAGASEAPPSAEAAHVQQHYSA